MYYNTKQLSVRFCHSMKLVIIATSQPSVWVDQSGTQQRWRFPYLFRLAFFMMAVLSPLAGKIILLRSIYISLPKTIKFTFCLSLFFFFTGDTWTWGIADDEEFQRRLPSLGKPNRFAMLKNASMESHGFTKEIITSDRRDSKTNDETFEKMYFYYKVVNCSRASEVVKTLQTLMPGKHFLL